MKIHPVFQSTVKSNMPADTECTEYNRTDAELTATLLPELDCQFQTMEK